MPRRTVEPSAIAGVHVLSWPLPPLLAARNQLQLDDALGAERDLHVAVEILRGLGHEDALALAERGADRVGEHYLREMRRADFLLAFRDEHEVDRHLATGG